MNTTGDVKEAIASVAVAVASVGAVAASVAVGVGRGDGSVRSRLWWVGWRGRCGGRWRVDGASMVWRSWLQLKIPKSMSAFKPNT